MPLTEHRNPEDFNYQFNLSPLFWDNDEIKENLSEAEVDIDANESYSNMEPDERAREIVELLEEEGEIKKSKIDTIESRFIHLNRLFCLRSKPNKFTSRHFQKGREVQYRFCG